jgi:hypothetical protein
MTTKSYVAKAATLLVAPVVLSASAEARIVYVDNQPISLTLKDLHDLTVHWSLPGRSDPPPTVHYSFESWDVDGERTADFVTATFGYIYGFRQQGRKSMYQNLYIDPGLIEWVMNGSGKVADLHNSFSVGPTLAQYSFGGLGKKIEVLRATYQKSTYWRRTSYTTSLGYSIRVNYRPSVRTNASSYRLGFDFANLQQGENLVGFRAYNFTESAWMYGWAAFEAAPGEVTLSKWAYEKEIGKSIHVGAIPAPPAALSSLTLLAIGAAGVRRMRKQKEAKAAA